MAWLQIDDLRSGLISGLDISLDLGLDDLWETVKAAADTGKKIIAGTVKLDELAKEMAVSFGQSIIQPFKNLYNNFSLVLLNKPRDPKDNEVYEYGESLGSVVTTVGGLFAGGMGFKNLFKKLKDTLTNVFNKKRITSGNNTSHSNSSSKYSDDAIPCNCFVAGTEILTDEGLKPIEDIEIGDKVLAKDPDTEEIAYKEVEELYRNTTDKTYNLYIGEEIITTTGGHPFWVVDKGWVYAENLVVGDKLETDNGTIITIDDIVVKDEYVGTYNFSVKDYHTYYVSSYSILVHNTSSGGNCKYEGNGKIDLSKSTNPSDFLKAAVERQGLNKAPGKFQEKWTEGDYKYEVRAHKAESQYGKTGSIYRVSRQKHGEGTEYMDSNGKWHHESTLKETYKDGRPNPLFNEDAARDTHIQLP